MKVYFYDINTKRYTGEGKALDNPENPNNPHIQGNAVTIQPPEYGEFEIPYFVPKTAQWEVKPCYIGKKAVHTESKFVETVYYEGGLRDGWQYVTDETAEEIQSLPERYKTENGKLVRRTDVEYEKHLADLEIEKRKTEIKAKLDALDAEAVRPLRAEIAGTATDEDIQKLKDIEERAKALRAEYQALEV